MHTLSSCRLVRYSAVLNAIFWRGSGSVACHLHPSAALGRAGPGPFSGVFQPRRFPPWMKRPAIEVLCADKTGTLTLNELR